MSLRAYGDDNERAKKTLNRYACFLSTNTTTLGLGPIPSRRRYRVKWLDNGSWISRSRGLCTWRVYRVTYGFTPSLPLKGYILTKSQDLSLMVIQELSVSPTLCSYARPVLWAGSCVTAEPHSNQARDKKIPFSHIPTTAYLLATLRGMGRPCSLSYNSRWCCSC